MKSEKSYLIELYYGTPKYKPFIVGSYEIKSVEGVNDILEMIEGTIKASRHLLSTYHIEPFVSIYSINGKSKLWLYDKVF